MEILRISIACGRIESLLLLVREIHFASVGRDDPARRWHDLPISGAPGRCALQTRLHFLKINLPRSLNFLFDISAQ
jgi:hypothetical protein